MGWQYIARDNRWRAGQYYQIAVVFCTHLKKCYRNNYTANKSVA